ncbi:RNA polymerase sigma factor [Paenalkalicoccus suaedae]|nr:RNA polymerase sigma factor [Paenalkalicoccus suaedae]
MNEQRWIRRIQKKADQKSADKLIEKYYEEMYRFAYRQMIDKHLALDMTQEIFIKMLQGIEHYDPERASFRTWLYRVAQNACVDYFRSKQYAQVSRANLTDEIDDPATTTAAAATIHNDIELALVSKEQYAVVQACIAEYSTQIQYIMRYKLFQDYTFAEISTELDLPESTVKTNYYKVIKRLRSKLEGYYHEEA